MNSIFTAKYLQNLRNKKGNKGFTLIELLVVVIIIGVLAAVALPNLLGQVAKGRQAEAKNNLGSINRAQQAERLETGSFQPYLDLPVGITGTNYAYADVGTPSATQAEVSAIAVPAFNNDILDYTGEVTQSAAGAFTSVICEEASLNAGTPGGDGTGGCTTGNPIN